MMRKRILSAILAIVMVFSVLPNGVFATAATDIVAAAGNVEAPLVENSTVSVPVVFTENSGIAQIMIQMGWDDSALELTSVTFGGLPDAGSAPISETKDGTYLVYAGDWQMTEDYVGTNEPVFTLNFKILPGAQVKTYDITMNALENREALDANMQVKTVGFMNGSVKLVESANSHLQWVKDDSVELYADTNLWTRLEPKKEYHTGTKWRYDHATVYSVTIPVKEGDKIYANSFQAKPANEGTSSGIAVAFFYNGELVSSLLPAQCYAEYNENGFITVPEGVNEVCIPVWKNNANAVVNLLTLPQRVDSVELSMAAPVTGEVPVTEISGESYTGAVSWSGDPDMFAAETVYTATATLSAKEGYKFPADATVTLNGETVTAERDVDGKLVVTYTFPATAKKDISSAELTITAPKTEGVPETTVSGTGFTGAITWSPEVDGKFAANTVYTATVVLAPAESYQFADAFSATINGEAVEFTVSDGTATGAITFAATIDPVNSHLQWVKDDSVELYTDTNLWTLLEPKKEYHTGTKWRYDHATVYSVTIPVKEGDKIYANSFQAKPANEGTSSGIAVAFFYNGELVSSLLPAQCYAEYNENGFITVPEGVNEVCIPVWKNNANAVVNLLTLPVRISTAELSVVAPVTGETPVTEISGESYTGVISWIGNPDKFASETVYTATVTLSAKEGYKFPADATATVNGASAEAERNAEGKLVVTYTFPATAKNDISSVTLNITAPVKGAAPQSSVEAGENYTGTISWNGDPDAFAANTVYTATVVLTPNGNYVFAENAAATVNGETAAASLGADGKLTVTYTFPVTAKNEIASAELIFAAPKTQGVPATVISGAGFIGAITWSPEVEDTFAIDTVYTATVVLTPAEDYQFASNFTATINGEAVAFTVSDGTATGEITFAATVEPVNSHVQWVDDESELYADTNLWTLLIPNDGYYKGSTWSTNYPSITIPVEEGDKIYANSFKAKNENGVGHRNGIAVAYLYGENVVTSLAPDAVYAEYKENGYLTIPAGVNAVNIPMWVNNDSSVVNLLSLPERIAEAELTVAAPVTGETPVTKVSGESYTGTVSWSGDPDKFAAETVYTATVTLIAREGYKFPADFTATVNGEAVVFVVNPDGTVTGSVTFEVTEEASNSHLQWVEDDSELYFDTNLWPLLEPKHEYHTGTIWRENHKDIWSVTIPVKEGDQIYASSFQSKTITGGTSNGIAVAFFYNEDVVSSLLPAQTYAEYTANGYITVPAGVNAVCIPVWKNDENAVVKLLTLPDRPSDVLVGDVNDDGSVTPKDAMILSRYVNNWPDAGVVSMSAADINKDGVVTPKDAMILIRYVSNWPGYDNYF